MLVGVEMMLRVKMRIGLGMQIGLEIRIGLVIRMGPGILVYMYKALHLPATKYEHVYSVSYWHFAYDKFFLYKLIDFSFCNLFLFSYGVSPVTLALHPLALFPSF